MRHLLRPAAKSITLNIGPTNSGKTYAALEKLKLARRGCYAAPLRLLAHEIYDQLVAAGIRTTLLTGQHRIVDPDATHISCTAEMMPVNTQFDVGVVDEVQMIGSLDRGFAWTNAVFSMRADELFLCGAPNARPLLERIVAPAPLQVVEFNRRSTLSMQNSHVESLDHLCDGDCLVAFSRKSLYEMRKRIRRPTSLIYGGLPPAQKTSQAQLFNNGTHGILLASDAVGMGLNLNIKRVIFATASKFDGVEHRLLTAPEVQQIAGRAGRGSVHGTVSALNEEALHHIRACLGVAPDPVPRAGLAPSLEQLLLHAGGGDVADNARLQKMLEDFVDDWDEGHQSNFFLCDLTEITVLAGVTDHFRHKLSIAERYQYAMAPVDTNSEIELMYFARFLRSHADERHVPLGIKIRQSANAMAQASDSALERLSRLEALYSSIDTYLWLSHHFGRAIYDEQDAAMAARAECSSEIDAILMSTRPELKKHDRGEGGGGGRRRRRSH